MAKHTLSEAVKLTGKSRSTIHRRMADGQLSYERNDNGVRVVDTSELIRVFGELKPDMKLDTVCETVSKTRDETRNETGETSFLREKVELLEQRIEELRQDKERDREEYKRRDETQQAEKQKLLTLLERSQMQLDGTHLQIEDTRRRRTLWQRFRAVFIAQETV